MPSKKNIVVVAAATLLLVAVFIKLQSRGSKDILVSPGVSPTPTPQTFPIDANTDLEKELESVTPKVLDSDFAELDN